MDTFVDSTIWIASRFGAGAERDWANSYLARDHGLFLSTFIIDEIVAYCIGSRDLKHKTLAERRQMAGSFLKLFQESGAVQVLQVSDAQFTEAKIRFEQSRLGLSLTDWTGLIVARDHGITDLATYDRAFGDAARTTGFERIRVLPADYDDRRD
jgi:predicted nucleic acid-binding protein